MLAISVADILDASIAILVVIIGIYVGVRWFSSMAGDIRTIREAIARIEGRLEGMGTRRFKNDDPLDLDLPPKD